MSDDGDDVFADRVTPRFPMAEERYVPGGKRDPSLLQGRYGDELRAAIDDVYRTFAEAKLSDPLIGCPHCFTPSDLHYLATTPLQSFNHRELYLIATKLVSTLGESDDVAYFTPRIIEALAEGMAMDIAPFADHVAEISPVFWRAERTAALGKAFRMLYAAMAERFGEDPKDGEGVAATDLAYVRRMLPWLFESDS